MTSEATPTSELLTLLDPLLARVAALSLDLGEASSAEAIQTVEATLEREFPHAGERVQALGRTLAEGVRDGWLANRGAPESRFSRIAKAGPATHGLSVDIVSMVGAGLEHTHPRGEITIGFAAAGAGAEAQSCQFEGREPGWVVLGPGSRHVPRVDGERMNLIYFLPDGAVEWHPPAKP